MKEEEGEGEDEEKQKDTETNVEPPEDSLKIMTQLTKFIYNCPSGELGRIRTRAMLCQIYHHALHDRCTHILLCILEAFASVALNWFVYAFVGCHHVCL